MIVYRKNIILHDIPIGLLLSNFIHEREKLVQHLGVLNVQG
jgi:hypothetical protein